MHFLSSDKEKETLCFLLCLESEDDCIGCPHLVPLNDTDGLQLIQNSLDSFNKNNTLNNKFALLEIGRMSSQVNGISEMIFY